MRTGFVSSERPSAPYSALDHLKTINSEVKQLDQFLNIVPTSNKKPPQKKLKLSPQVHLQSILHQMEDKLRKYESDKIDELNLNFQVGVAYSTLKFSAIRVQHEKLEHTEHVAQMIGLLSGCEKGHPCSCVLPLDTDVIVDSVIDHDIEDDATNDVEACQPTPSTSGVDLQATSLNSECLPTVTINTDILVSFYHAICNRCWL